MCRSLKGQGRVKCEPCVSTFPGNKNTSAVFSMEEETVQGQSRYRAEVRTLLDSPKSGHMRKVGLPFTVHDAPMDISRYAVEGYSQLLPYTTGSSLSANEEFSLDKFVISCFRILYVRFDRMRR